MEKHIPVLLEEVLRYLEPKPGEVFVDCTTGASAGHSSAIAKALAPEGSLICLDLDQEALQSARTNLEPLGIPLCFQQGNFADIRELLARCDVQSVHGILCDCGFSTEQMSSMERGFSFQSYSRPEMLLDPTSDQPDALEIIRTSTEKEIADILWRFGEEKLSRRIARKIVKHRPEIETCRDLADLIENIYPKGPQRIHPATRSFMALRIYVNRELENLDRFIPEAFECLKPLGRLAIITYHSREVVLVKKHFRTFTGECKCPPGLPVCGCGATRTGRVVSGSKGVRPEKEEIEANPKSRSAQLRVIQKLETS